MFINVTQTLLSFFDTEESPFLSQVYNAFLWQVLRNMALVPSARKSIGLDMIRKLIADKGPLGSSGETKSLPTNSRNQIVIHTNWTGVQITIISAAARPIGKDERTNEVGTEIDCNQSSKPIWEGCEKCQVAGGQGDWGEGEEEDFEVTDCERTQG